MIQRTTISIFKWALVLGLTAVGYPHAEAEMPALTLQLRDIAYIPGSPLTLTGYGLVVGLPGTGDGSIVALTDSTLTGSVRRLGIDVETTPVHVREAATVLLTATVAPGNSSNQPLEVNIIALGDAQALAGGVLLPTSLMSADGAITAKASGPLVDASSIATQSWVGARLQSGAILTAPAFRTLVTSDSVDLALKPSLTTDQKLALISGVNARVGTILSLGDNGLVSVALPDAYSEPSLRDELLDVLASTSVTLAVEGLVASALPSATNGANPTPAQGW